MNGVESTWLRRDLASNHGIPTTLFQYGTFGAGFTANADRLREFLDTVDADRVHLVGHSTGGLMALVALARRAFERPGRIVCLGSPLRGSMAAAKLAALGEFGQFALGATGREGLVGQVLERYDGDRDVGVIAGTTAMGAGLVLADLPEPNDGTIAVVETQLPGIRDHLTLPVTHTGMLVSDEVALQVAFFLRHGRFNRAVAPATPQPPDPPATPPPSVPPGPEGTPPG
jgi:pimeloyl-ACP methyl ester carboxylesterase